MDERLEGPHDSAQPSPKTKRSARDLWLLAVLLLLALALGTGIGAGLSPHFESDPAAAKPEADCGVQRARADAIASVSTAPIRLEPARSVATTPSEETRASDGAPRVLSPDPRSPIAPQPTRKRGTTSPADAPPDKAAPSLTPGPDLHEALQLLRAAQQALKAGDATRALSLLDQMARRTPKVLVEEREVTLTLAHCAADDVDSARRTATALRQSGVASVYAHRLSKSCVGPAPAPEGLLEEMRRRALN